MPRIMIVAGEASGDLHAANLVRAAKRVAPELEFYGMGGDRMKAAGVDLIFDLERMSMMGLVEIISKLRGAYQTLDTLGSRLFLDKPEALVIVDYPDFNLRLARYAKNAGVPVIYFVCPQIWAWRTGRIKQMTDLVERRIVVFPFEVDFYEKHGVSSDFVGHPLLDVMDPPKEKSEAKEALGLDPDRPLLLLMPGSRKHLVEELLPVMIESANRIREKHPELAVAVARADTMRRDFLVEFLSKGGLNAKVIGGQSHLLQNAADLAIVASGTSTLETALMLTPMVVIYRVHFFSYLLARMLVKTDHVAMANLIAGERVVPELLQDECNPDRIAEECLRILDEPGARETMVGGLERVREKLGGPGACERSVGIILETIGRADGSAGKAV